MFFFVLALVLQNTAFSTEECNEMNLMFGGTGKRFQGSAYRSHKRQRIDDCLGGCLYEATCRCMNVLKRPTGGYLCEFHSTVCKQEKLVDDATSEVFGALCSPPTSKATIEKPKATMTATPKTTPTSKATTRTVTKIKTTTGNKTPRTPLITTSTSETPTTSVKPTATSERPLTTTTNEITTTSKATTTAPDKPTTTNKTTTTANTTTTAKAPSTFETPTAPQTTTQQPSTTAAVNFLTNHSIKGLPALKYDALGNIIIQKNDAYHMHSFTVLNDYKYGFEDGEDYWLGNHWIHLLTKDVVHHLIITAWDLTGGEPIWENKYNFQLRDASAKYRVEINLTRDGNRSKDYCHSLNDTTFLVGTESYASVHVGHECTSRFFGGWWWNSSPNCSRMCRLNGNNLLVDEGDPEYCPIVVNDHMCAARSMMTIHHH